LRESYGTLAEFTHIKQAFTKLQQAYEESDIADRKEDMMHAMSQPGFWQSREKQEVLSHIEYYDRFEAAFDTTETLLERLKDPDKVRLEYDPSLLKKLAQKIYLLQASLQSYLKQEPQDAVLKISYEAQHADWGKRIVEMYMAWAKRRKMIIKKVQAGTDTSEPFSVYYFSGFGCYAILQTEDGVHLQEWKPAKSKMVEKSRVRVSVLPLDSSEYHLVEEPPQLLKKFPEQGRSKVIRRFNMDSQQCKDRVNKWQTGNIETVLKGLFDVME
ncbi:MAG: PCRF domain-containing protein, partial [Bacteroidota bacterium]